MAEAKKEEEEGYRAERGDAGTVRPIAPPEPAPGAIFEPFEVEDRPNHFQELPPTPLSLFQLFFTEEWIDQLVTHSNIPAEGPLQEHSREHQWRHNPLTHAELWLFLGCLIYMGLHVEHSIRQYWSTSDSEPAHTLPRYLSLRRFEAIYTHFRTWDPEEHEDPRQRKTFLRIQALSIHIQEVSLQLCTPGSLVTIDEAMIRYTGRDNAASVIKSKPTPRGFKVWVVATRGYFLRWLFHINNRGPIGIPYPHNVRPRPRLPQNASDEEQDLHKLSDTYQLVVTLIRLLPKHQYHLFIDNLFTSPALLLFLRKYCGTGATGTARENSGIFKDFVLWKKEDRKNDSIEWNTVYSVPMLNGLVNQFLWKDNATALFFSTVFTGKEEWAIRRRAKPKTKTASKYFPQSVRFDVPVPAFGDSYNYLKGGVDTGDQLRSYSVWNHPIRGPHFKALFQEFLLEAVLVNTYILQRDFPGPLRWRRCLKQEEWRKALYTAIFVYWGPRGSRGAVNTNNNKRKAPESTDLVAVSFAEHEGGPRPNSDCLACKGRTIYSVRSTKKRVVLGEVPNAALNSGANSGRRKTTRWGCLTCNVALCNSDKCWYLWHGQK